MASPLEPDTMCNSGVERESVRRQIDAWLSHHWDPDLPLVEWRRRLVDSGWAAVSWPPQWYGRGLPSWAGGVVRRALQEAGAVGCRRREGHSILPFRAIPRNC